MIDGDVFPGLAEAIDKDLVGRMNKPEERVKTVVLRPRLSRDASRAERKAVCKAVFNADHKTEDTTNLALMEVQAAQGELALRDTLAKLEMKKHKKEGPA